MNKIALITFACMLLSHAAHAEEVKIPFVGCPADGQAGALDPPKGEAKTVHLEGALPVPFAYYQGEQGPGVYAPAGWHCRVWYGSDGGFVIVTPAPINPPYFPAPSFSAPVVQLSTVIADTSGRFEAARLCALLFPKLTKKFVKEVEDEEVMLEEKPRRYHKYPTDTLKYLSPRAVQFVTPANTRGLGTVSHIEAANYPIEGIVTLHGPGDKPTDVTLLNVSLGEGDPAVMQLILKLNSECMRSTGGC